MSQRECAGLNWPLLSIPAQEPVSISPEAVSRAGCGGYSVINCARVRPNPFPLPVDSLQRARLAASASASACANSLALGVGQPAKYACRGSWSMRSLPSRCATMPGVSFQSRAAGVTHPVEPVSDVRRTDARTRERDRPDGVTHGFQVIAYKVDPRICVLARNLLSKDDWRSALADEVVPVRPEVPLVSKAKSCACRAERLARTGTGPNRSVVTPSSHAEGARPYADSGEKVALSVWAEVVRSNIPDVSLVDVARRNVAGGDQVAQPLRGVWLDLVVVGSHASFPRVAA